MVSVVLPVRNEEKFIARCLGAIFAQTYPAERIEVIVADGMSDDRTREIIRSLPGGERVRILENPDRLQAQGLNVCIAAARGDVIVRVDGHTVISPEYVETAVDTLEKTGAWNVGGAITNTGIDGTGRAIAAAGSSPFGVPGPFHGSAEPQFTDTVYLGAWPRFVFEKIGGFSGVATPNEDYELNHRIRAAGGTVYYSPAIRSRYYGRQTLRDLARQYFRYGRGKVRVLAQHPRSLKLRHTVAPAFVGGLLIGALFCGIEFVRVMWLTMVGAYFAANLAVSARLAAKEELTLLPRIALAFSTMHIPWGLGFWVEVARRAVRRQ